MAPSALSASAQGASFLILLQVSSRALTFIVNQILLRYLSPQILGAATQLELFSISTLYFSRESIRVALQRQQPSSPSSIQESGSPTKPKTEKRKEDTADTSRQDNTSLQQAINLTYIAIALGIPLTILFQRLYLRGADPAVLSIPFTRKSLNVYALATILELLHEPFFATASHQLSYAVRTASEMQATLLRCLVTCAIAIYSHHHGQDVGVLPFAVGQLTYAIALLLGYAARLYGLYVRTGTSSFFRQPDDGGEHVPVTLVKLAGVLYAQSLFKQLLTSGDSYLVAALTSLESQGAYALASNYGGLLARVLFQPIEEASRTFFARTMPAVQLSSETQARGQEKVKHVERYLYTLLRLYAILSIALVCVVAPLTRPGLYIVAGKTWAKTDAPRVLAVYCYYIPFMAFNGLLEAFVSAVASPSDLRRQSYFMLGSSCVFALLGFAILGVYGAGAQGLVIVNILVMEFRIIYSWLFITQHLGPWKGGLEVSKCLPDLRSITSAVAMRAVLSKIVPFEGVNTSDLVIMGGLVGIWGICVLLFERIFLHESWSMFRSASNVEEKGPTVKKEN